MKNNFQEQTNIENLFTFIQPDLAAGDSLYLQTLRPFSERGLATAEQVSLLTKIEYKRVAELLMELSRTTGNRMAALRSVSVRLEGQRGRPKKLYLLTDEGAAVLKEIGGHQHLSAPKMTDGIEFTAAFSAMEIYSIAFSQGYKVKIEEPLYISGTKKNVRADILINLDGVENIFEIEQQENQGTLPRLVDKLGRMHNLFVSQNDKKICTNVRILFNLPKEDTKTIQIWQRAIQEIKSEVGELSFNLYAMLITDFLEKPVWRNLDKFKQIQSKSPTETHDQGVLVPGQEEQNKIPTKIDELRVAMRVRDSIYKKQLLNTKNSQNHSLRVEAFFEICKLTYKASHYNNSAVNLYAALPTDSLDFLNKYLHEDQNKSLLEDLNQRLNWIRKHNTSVMVLRSGIASLVWDGFLQYHGFGRGGPLVVGVVFPGFDEIESELFIDVRIRGELEKLMTSRGDYRYFYRYTKSLEEESLAWILNAILYYPNFLGLGSKVLINQKGKNI